jgi:hypothetical protein
MANKPDEKGNRQSAEQIPRKQEKSQMDAEYDALSEESTDYRGPGEKFETAGEGKNIDRKRMDQPRTGMPEALKDLGPATRRPLDANDEEEKKLYEERQRRMKKVA